MGRLHTRDHLSRHINNIPTSCPLWNSENESISILFMNCTFANQVWSSPEIINTIKINRFIQFNDWLESLNYKMDENLNILSVALLICWQIWKKRNLTVFQNKKNRP